MKTMNAVHKSERPCHLLDISSAVHAPSAKSASCCPVILCLLNYSRLVVRVHNPAKHSPKKKVLRVHHLAACLWNGQASSFGDAQPHDSVA
jgi:hypothetical protein